MLNSFLPGLSADVQQAQSPGLYAMGSYKDPGGVIVSFGANTAEVSGCGDLVPDSLSARFELKGNQAVVEVQNSAQPFTLTLRPDGKVVGPGTINVAASIVVGTDSQWYIPAPSATDLYPVGHTEYYSIYGPKTAWCAISLLASTGPITPDTGNFLGIFDDGSPKSIKPGLPLGGEYFGPGGFSIKFSADSALSTCGESADTIDYTVSNSGNQTIVSIPGDGTRVSPVYKSDGTLAGSGTVQVNGRRLALLEFFPPIDRRYQPRQQ
jgi:hypothetical protein